MPASVTDKLRKGYQAFSTTLASTKALGASTMSLSAAAGVPTDTAIDFTVGRVDSSGTSTPSTKAVYTGTLSGTTVSNLTLVEGTDQSHAAGSVVEITWTASTWNDAVDHLLTEHAQDGTHTAVTATSISNSGALTQTGATTLTGALTLKSYDGWITLTDTLVYASANTITVTGVDVTGFIQAGDKLKITQTTDKYFFVTKVAFSTDSTITVYGGTDYTVANAAITSPKISRDKSPFGFPVTPSKWTITTSDSNDCTKTTATQNTWYGDTGLSATGPNISLPTGVWNVSYSSVVAATVTSGTTAGVSISLSTSSNSESDSTLTCYSSLGYTGATAVVARIFLALPTTSITTTSATTYYLVIRSQTANTSVLSMLASTSGRPTIIRAVCAYL